MSRGEIAGSDLSVTPGRSARQNARDAALVSTMPMAWSIGIYVGESPVHLRPPPGVDNPVLSRSDISDVPVSFVADPFMIRVDDAWHMFFEAKNIVTKNGEIGLAVSPDGLKWTYSQIVLAEPFHLSYPYVFECGGEYYMIPETLQANHIRLYKAEQFPTRWTHIANLMEGQFADSSIIFFEDRWWIFACTRPFDHDVLCLFFSDSLLGPWVEHPQSPIVAGDPHVARPAGRVVAFNGGLIRYAQDCYPRYGTRVSAFEISKLTPTSYRETACERSPILTPGPDRWNGLGMHHIDPHLNTDGKWIACVDGRYLE
jgi:hypothetical protein